MVAARFQCQWQLAQLMKTALCATNLLAEDEVAIFLPQAPIYGLWLLGRDSALHATDSTPFLGQQ